MPKQLSRGTEISICTEKLMKVYRLMMSVFLSTFWLSTISALERGTHLKLCLKVTSSIDFYGSLDLGIVNFQCQILVLLNLNDEKGYKLENWSVGNQ